MAKNNEQEAAAVALVGSTDFRAVAVIGETGENLMDLLRENVGDQISVFDFAKLTVPPGGGDHWSIPTADGTKMEKEVEGVILMRKSGKAYWRLSLDDSTENTPPDCSSDDGQVGIGEPGGVCATCPLNQYETAAKGKGKACKDKCDIFLLTKTGILPLVIQVPPTSLKNFKQYGMLLLDAGKDISKVLTKLSLSVETKSGKKTAIIQFRSGGDVDPSMYPFVAEYKRSLKAMVEANPAAQDPVAVKQATDVPTTDGEAPTFD